MRDNKVGHARHVSDYSMGKLVYFTKEVRNEYISDRISLLRLCWAKEVLFSSLFRSSVFKIPLNDISKCCINL